MPLCNHFGLFILISSANPLDTWRIIDWVCANIVPLLVVVAVNDDDDFFVIIGTRYGIGVVVVIAVVVFVFVFVFVFVVIVVRTNFLYTE